MTVPAVDLRDVAHVYPDGREALAGAHLRVEQGERIAILGPNGAGKTTLALHLNGVLEPSRGSVHIEGLPVAEPYLKEIRRRVGIVFQDPDDQLFMPTVRDDVAFGPANFGVPRAEHAERVTDALASVGMSQATDRTPHHLSFGERRRVAIATVLACRPSILVLDEPTANLDPASRRELADVLAGLDVTILVCTHDLPFALEHCPRSIIMSHGKVVADDTTSTLLANAALMTANRLELPYRFDARSAAS